MGRIKEVTVAKENKTMCAGTYDVLYWTAAKRSYSRLERKFKRLFGDAAANREEWRIRGEVSREAAMERAINERDYASEYVA
jgi:hypothetical protein